MRPEVVITRGTVISPRVSVPVLSDAMTEAEPSVSTEASCFTMALWRAMQRTPMANTTERMAVRPSGTAATASDTPSNRTATTSPMPWMLEMSRIVPTTTAAVPSAAMPSTLPRCAISRCSGVGASGVVSSKVAMPPISVCMPVAVTMARPVPCATAVPLKTMFSRSPRAAGARSGAASFSTASLSPVSGASSSFSAAACTKRASGAHRVVLGEHQQVALDQPGAGHPGHRAVAQHAGGGGGHLRHRRHRLHRLVFLQPTQHRIEHHHSGDHNGVQRPAGDATLLTALEPPSGQGHCRCRAQQIDQWVLQLRKRSAPSGHGRDRAKFVGAVFEQPGGGLTGAGPTRQVGAERQRQIGDVAQRRIVGWRCVPHLNRF